MLSEKPVIAVTINHEGLSAREARDACRRLRKTTGVPSMDALLDGPSELMNVLRPFLQRAKA
jgi:uncharacterized NAD-dependent epimerase/dehydratase family protein